MRYFKDVIRGTVQDQAKCLYGIDGHAFVFPQGVQSSGTEVVFFDQLILCDIFPFQSLPKWTVVKHRIFPLLFDLVYSHIFQLHIAECSAII